MAGVGPGVRVLELGTGAGDVALFAAGRGANVVATDLSEAMLEAARQAAGDAGAANVEFRRMDASALEFGATEFDAVIARHVLMFLPDLPVALARVRRVLRPGGKFAAIVWGPLAENPFQAALIETARTPPPTSEMVIAFSLSRERLESAMQRAGFRQISIEKVGGESRYPSLAEALRLMQANPVQSALFAGLDEADRTRAWAEVERRLRPYQTEVGFATPISVLVAAGTA